MRRRGATAVILGAVLVVGGVAALAFGRALSAPVDYSTVPLSERFERAESWEDFVAERPREPEVWWARYEAGEAAVAAALPDLADRAGTWRLLVVAEAWCGDTRETLPYLARLADAASNLELAIVSKAEADDLLEAYPAEGGRKAIPLVLVLDQSWQVRGAWIEQPEPLRQLIAEEAPRLEAEALLDAIRGWHEEDAGRTVLTEVLEVLEAARLSLASAGRRSTSPGIARSAASCSIGWCVGPSSPSPRRRGTWCRC